MTHTNTGEIPKRQLRQTAVSGSRFVPMLFSTPMVKAILNGTKTETRRILKINPLEHFIRINGDNAVFQIGACYVEKIPLKVKVGDIIWVRETFCNDKRGYESGQDDSFYYKADMTYDIWLGIWKPSMFMPKKACRIFLEVVSVSVERLQDIDEQSAINEGAKHGRYLGLGQIGGSFREGYFELWDSINGKNATITNPFVWVYKFQRIDEPHGFR